MNNLLSELMMAIEGSIEPAQLSRINNHFAAILNNYNIEKKTTEVAAYTGYLPECYKTYLINAKINGVSDNTLKLYNLVLKDFLFKVNKSLEEITVMDIRAYLFRTQQERGISNRTLNNRRTIINAFLEWCTNEEYIDKNPCRNVKKIKYIEKPREALTAIQMERIRNGCTTKRDRAIIEFFYSTGCRVTELIRLKKSDLNIEKGEVTLFGKGNKYRTAFLNGKAIFYLTEYLNERDDGSEYVFVSSKKPHSQMTKEGIEKCVKSIGNRAGVDNVFPHRFRHTTATDCIQRGMPVEDVQKMLGHSNINTTMIYAKIDNSQVKAEHKKCIV